MVTGSIYSREMPTGYEQVHEAVDVRNGENGGNEVVTFTLIHPNDGKESIALTITGSNSSDDQERKSCVQRTICASIGVFMLMLIPVVQLWPESEQPPSSSTSPLQKLTTSGFDWTTSRKSTSCKILLPTARGQVTRTLIAVLSNNEGLKKNFALQMQSNSSLSPFEF